MPLINADTLDTSAQEDLIEGILPRTGTGILWGPSTWGKSLVILDAALAVANGTPFFGHEAVHGSVIYCLGEGLLDAGIRKEARLARQATEDATAIEAVRAQRGDASAEAFAASLPAYTDDRLFVETEPFTLPLSAQNEPTRELASFIARARQVPDLEMVILDSLQDFGSLSISNEASGNRYMLGMKWISRELDCLVVAVAHPTKDGRQMIGAQRLFASSDFVVEIVPELNGQPGELKSATLTSRKAKYGPQFEPISYEIVSSQWNQPVRDADGDPIGDLTETIKTATVQPRTTGEGGSLRMPGAVRPPRPLPELQTIPRRRKRNGLRSVDGGSTRLQKMGGAAMGIILLAIILPASLGHHTPAAPAPRPAVAAVAKCVPIQQTVPGKSTLTTTAVYRQGGSRIANLPAATHPICAKNQPKANRGHHRLFRAYVAYRIARHIVPYGVRHPFRRHYFLRNLSRIHF